MSKELLQLFAFLFAISFSFVFVHAGKLNQSRQLRKDIDSTPITINAGKLLL